MQLFLAFVCVCVCVQSLYHSRIMNATACVHVRQTSYIFAQRPHGAIATPYQSTARTTAAAARDSMISKIEGGATVTKTTGDASTKSLLVRGCDPGMASRTSKMLPPLLGNPTFDTATDDDTFLKKLKDRKWGEG